MSAAFTRLHEVNSGAPVLVNMDHVVSATLADNNGTTLWLAAGPDDHVDVTEPIEEVSRRVGLPWYPEEAPGIMTLP